MILRDLRVSRKVTLRELAKRLHRSAPYISDLELGRRGWSGPRVRMYIEAMGEPFEPFQMKFRVTGGNS
jgi:transcriptional regulator with XRE-family HTH domain